MTTRGIVFAAAVTLAVGCTEQPDETREIVENLVQAGFPADDIAVVDGVVYVGRDAEVSLAASREMLQAGDSSEEQYRTTNLISTSLSKICIDGSTFTGVFSTALDLAIQNYDELPLTFAMGRTPSTGCSFTINAVIQPGFTGGSAGFPSGGLPYSTITIGDGLAAFSVDTIAHVITHEIGHTIGFRHSDYYDRSISCGSGGNEGDAGVGAIHIPGTPTDAVVGGSLMNSCFGAAETGELTSSDVTALTELYGPPSGPPPIPDPISKLSEYCRGWNNIYWTAQPRATYYELHRSLSSSFISPVVIYSGPNTEALINVSMSPVWYLRAKACNATAGCSAYTSQISARYWTSYCQ
jgi:hypothetical protein